MAMTRFEQKDHVRQACPPEERQADWINHVQDLLAQAKPDAQIACAASVMESKGDGPQRKSSGAAPEKKPDGVAPEKKPDGAAPEKKTEGAGSEKQAAQSQPIAVPDFRGSYYLIGGKPRDQLKEVFRDKAKPRR